MYDFKIVKTHVTGTRTITRGISQTCIVKRISTTNPDFARTSWVNDIETNVE